MFASVKAEGQLTLQAPWMLTLCEDKFPSPTETGATWLVTDISCSTVTNPSASTETVAPPDEVPRTTNVPSSEVATSALLPELIKTRVFAPALVLVASFTDPIGRPRRDHLGKNSAATVNGDLESAITRHSN